MTVLVDTGIWINHLRSPLGPLAQLLADDQVLIHPWILGELALGSLADRQNFLGLLDCLPSVEEVPARRVLSLIDNQGWFAAGIGWVDAQVLAACLLHPCRLWTSDRRLHDLAGRLGLTWTPHSSSSP